MLDFSFCGLESRLDTVATGFNIVYVYVFQLKQAFTLFDLKGNGYLTKEEIGAVLRNLAQYPTDEELEKMFVDIDQDGDGQLSFIEFVKLMYNMGNISEKSEEEEEAELKAAFKVIYNISFIILFSYYYFIIKESRYYNTINRK